MQNEQALNPARIAALVYSQGQNPEPVLAALVDVLRTRKVALAGTIQHSHGPCSMVLEILPSGVRMPISQNLGRGASGCRLDAAALAEAASMVRRALGTSPALVVFNKFGAQEASGNGLSDEMAEAALSGLPMLTAVNEKLLPQWSAFTGGAFSRLPCSVEAALAWWQSMQPD